MRAGQAPRVAVFADCFREVNGAALTCRQLERYAQRNGAPLLVVARAPASAAQRARFGAVDRLELPRTLVSIPIDVDMRFDLLFWRSLELLERELDGFQADLVHIIGPGDLGLAGAIVAHRLRVPLVASWHTNLHEFAVERLRRLLPPRPAALRERLLDLAGGACWKLTVRFYRIARALLAPTPEMRRRLAAATGKPVYLMGRGVDTRLFHPGRRTRTDSELVVGYVGRLTPEKSVRKLALVHEALERSGLSSWRLLVVGAGSEEVWLRRNLRRAEFAGVLRGEELAAAYANMDIFVFPSRTDTFGNVVQEALASGVPAVVTDAGGPRLLVADGHSGFVTCDDDQFCEAVVALARDAALRRSMSRAAAAAIQGRSWDDVFDALWRVYREIAAQPAAETDLTPVLAR